MQNTKSRASTALRPVHVILGIVTASCGVVLSAFLALWARSTEHPLLDLNLALCILSVVALFFIVTGFRLLTGRGASTGDGLLSPAGYCGFGGLVLLVGVRVVWGLASIEPLRAAYLGAAFSVTCTMCFTVAWRRARFTNARCLTRHCS